MLNRSGVTFAPEELPGFAMESKLLVRGGSLTAFAGTVASIASFTGDSPTYGYVLGGLAAIGIISATVPFAVVAYGRSKRLYQALVRLSGPPVPQITLTGRDIAEHEDREKLTRVAREMADVCSTLDATLASAEIDDHFSRAFLMVRLVRTVLGQTAHLFQEFSQHPVVVMVQGRDGGNKENAVILFRMPNIPHHRKNSQPKIIGLKGTVIEEVLDTGNGKIVGEVTQLARDDVWKSRGEFLNSMIAWPIEVNGNVMCVLKIDSKVAGAFRDTSATRMLADVCARKISHHTPAS